MLAYSRATLPLLGDMAVPSLTMPCHTEGTPEKYGAESGACNRQISTLLVSYSVPAPVTHYSVMLYN